MVLSEPVLRKRVPTERQAPMMMPLYVLMLFKLGQESIDGIIGLIVFVSVEQGNHILQIQL